MPQVVFTLWAILLIVTVLLLPYIVYLLHRTWVAAKNIERYFKESLDAGLGIAASSDKIVALDDTITVASGMLEVAGSINKHAEIVKDTVGGRAAKLN